jgi:hypothetical protein
MVFRLKLLRFLFFLCLVPVLVAFLSAGQVSAQMTYANDKRSPQQPTLQVVVGFAGDARLDFWVPAVVTLRNDGPAFTGTLAATTYTSSGRTRNVVRGLLPWSYGQPIQLPRGALKQITINVPFYESPSVPQGVVASLSDARGSVIASATDEPFALNAGTVLIGILSDQPAQGAGFTPLSAATLPDPSRSLQLVPLSASTLPASAAVLDNFDVIVLDDFATDTLSAAQLDALQTWINQGGAFIEIGGPQWHRTLGALPPQLLPVELGGTGALPAGASLLPIGGPGIGDGGQAPTAPQQSIAINTASLPAATDDRRQAFSNLASVLASGSTPLLVQAEQGQGTICFLAFDPAAEPLIAWPGTIALWKGLLLRSLNEQSLLSEVAPRYSSGPGGLNLRGGLFQVIQPATLFPVWTLLFLLVGYIIFIGPVRLLILRRLKRPAWSWRIILASVVVFALLSFGLASYQRGASVNSISIMQFNQGGQSAHVTTFFNVFAPAQGKVQLRLPGADLAQPIVNEPFQMDDQVGSNVTFTAQQGGTTIHLPDAAPWTLNTLVAEGDQRVQGGLTSHLALHGGTVSGTLNNTLGTSLSDVYVLMPHSFAYIGHLQAGQTQQVSVQLHSSPLTSSTTLADQIARANHLTAPFFPYGHGSQPANAFQRHLAMLSALSGEGYDYDPCHGPCSTHALVSKQVIATSPFFGGPPVTPLDSHDALLIQGAPATVIGWAEQPFGAADGASVNGVSPAGTHDSLLQIPLNIDISGLSDLPPGQVSGQLVNAQGDGVQFISPGVYDMTTGSITFAFTLPPVPLAQVHALSIDEPFIGGHASVRLYNWRTGSWDSVALATYSLQSRLNAAGDNGSYLSPDGHVLLQLVTRHASAGPTLFEKPSLSVHT